VTAAPPPGKKGQDPSSRCRSSGVTRGAGTDSAPKDGELLARFRTGDPDAFDLLVERYQGRLLRLAGAALGDSSSAEDVVQETFVRLLRHAPEPGPNGAVGGWLFRVCRNLACDTMRTEIREKRRRERASVPGLAPSGPEGAAEAELREIVARELDRLPAREGDVLRRKLQEGQTYREIAAATGMAPGTVGWLVHTGLQRLSARLRAAGVLGVS